MNYNYLRYFSVLAREEHYTLAAARLGISQPSLSSAINHLETELGDVKLFEKVGRNIRLTDEERLLLAKVIWVEAQGECEEGQQAVAEVVLNRMASPNFGNTLKGVIYAQGQFRSVPYLDDAEPYQAQYDAIERAIYGPYVLPEDVVHFATFRTNDNVWGKIGGHIFCDSEDRVPPATEE